MIRRFLSKFTIFALTVFVAACASGTFETMYATGLNTAITKDWRVVNVNVAVPRTLSVSEAHTLVPKADIVWREDPIGDRYQQVSRVVAKGIREGAKPLHGNREVRIDVTVSRFHAMTLEAEALKYDVGVHNIDFSVQVVDARTGEVLVQPTFIRAEFPATTGVRMTQARLRGETQATQIEAHLSHVIAGWLGVGPDPRATFKRIGG